MSLLTIAQRVTDEVGLTRPGAVATGVGQLERQLFALANAALEDIATCAWTMLETSYTFSTVVDQEVYTLPDDFKKYIIDTAYVSSLYYDMRGSLTPAEWARRRYAYQTGIGRYRFRMFGDPRTIHISPTPQLVETVTLEYTSKNLAKDATNTPIPLFFSDSDEPRVPEELVRLSLKWRIKHAKGLDYSEDYNAFEARKKVLIAQDLALGSQPVAYRSLAEIPELGDGYVPEIGYGV